MTDTAEHDDFLDFPGADDLVAAGAVTPPAADRIAAVRDVLALLADREAEHMPAPAHDAAALGAVARRGVPKAALAPPDDFLVVLGQGEPSWTEARRGRRVRRRRVLVAALAVAAIAVGAAVQPVLDMRDKRETTASAGTTETHAKYWKVRSVSYKAGVKETKTFFYDRTGRAWHVDENGEVVKSFEGTWRVGDESLAWAELDKLPTNGKLVAYFPKDHTERVSQIVRLLADSPASPRLRAALLRLLTTDTPGVKQGGSVSDAEGRRGTYLELFEFPNIVVIPNSNFWVGNEVIVDPETNRVVEIRHQTDSKASYMRETWLDSGPAVRVG